MVHRVLVSLFFLTPFGHAASPISTFHIFPNNARLEKVHLGGEKFHVFFCEKGKKKINLFWTASLRHPSRPAIPLAGDSRISLTIFEEPGGGPIPARGAIGMVWADDSFFLIDQNGAVFHALESLAESDESPSPDDSFAIEALLSPPDDPLSEKQVRSIFLFSRGSKQVFAFLNGRLDSPWVYELPSPFKPQGFSSLQVHGNRLVLGPYAAPGRRLRGPAFQVFGPEGALSRNPFANPAFIQSVLAAYPGFFDENELSPAPLGQPETARKLFQFLKPKAIGEPLLSPLSQSAGQYLRTSIELDLHAKMERALQARKNVLLVGPDGSGTEEVVRSFERANQRGLFPSFQERPIRYLTTIQLNSGRYVGDLDKALSAQFDKPNGQEPQPIYVIENVDRLVGEGRYQGQSNDFFDRVAPYLTRSVQPVQFVFTVSSEAFSYLPARFLSEHFQTFRLEDQALAVDLAAQVALHVSRQSGIFVSENVVQSALALTRKFDPNFAEPGRTARFLGAFKESRRSGLDEREATSDEVRSFAKEFYQVAPIEHSREASQTALAGLVPKMDETYFGAQALKQELLSLARRYLFGGAVANEPRGRILLVGLPGVGKTSLPMAFSLALFGKPAVEIAMNDHAGGGAYAVRVFTALLGELHTANPNVVVIFNEVERAHPDIQAALFAFMERRTIKYSTGTGKSEILTHATTDRAFWFFTSNAGATYFSNLDPSTQSVDTESFREYLANEEDRSLLPALLNRMEEIWPVFGPETNQDFEGVLGLNVQRLLKELSGAENAYPRQYSFPDLALFVQDWIRHRNAFTPRGPVRHHIASIKRTVADAISIRNETDHPSEITSPCVLSLADF